MPRYVFSAGKITVEEGVFTPFKREEKQSSRGVLLLARNLHHAEEQESTTDKERPDVRQ